MGRRKNTNFGLSLETNMRTYYHYLHRLQELSMAMFEWKNVPDSIDIRFLELTLFTDGVAVFFSDEVMGYLCLQVRTLTDFDVYRIPKMRDAYAINGYQKSLNQEDSVLIYNNMLHTNTFSTMDMYAKRLYNLDRIIDVNSNAQKTPILLKCDEEQRLTIENIYQKYDGNQPVIHGTKGIDRDVMGVLKTDAPYVADKIYELKTQYWNEVLTYLGISNINNQKKERMITDEVTRNAGGTVASRYSRLQSRKDACNKINKMFGLNMSVEYREDYQILDYDEALDVPINGEKKGGENNE